MHHILQKFVLTIFVLSLTSCATVAVDTSVSSATSPATYLLGEGDRIGIQVFDEPDLTMDSRVNARGSISYSYLGDIQVEGKTAEQLEQDIVNLLQDGYLVNPSVNVSIVEYRPFYINGEVTRPGSYPYQPGLTLDKAIALAGGLTDRASKRKMFVSRAGNAGGGQSQVELQAKINPGDIISIQEGFF